ncbi:M20/M25/M40 family metallo-hydrolase [Jiangella alba]|uniref:Acetylornithine deacetylase/Succinyl-diaminopimelate desuccinylase n=1 Tax=Jiangella alba TaxID=561176 RepID=A0A1H5L6L0_9ACTN|nr:M20/M25/M40 family metallo-hydrolase [Jiangella alba]SEE72594.1 Acetylornithine deacetylase/Succinyl-diaminopimelate desuccinylase [Jiangella alba]
MTTHPDVVTICSELIAIDTSNYGSRGGNGELDAARYVVGLLRAAGYDPELIVSEPNRANVVMRVAGTDRTQPGLLVHGHLDVVPAEPGGWTVAPFEGRVADGYVWGRGASDMKDMVAMMLATLRRWAARGVAPRRDVVFAFVADEEEDGALGAEWLVRHRPELFDGVAAAIGEAGGQAVPVEAPDGTVRRFYPVAVAERGSLHLRVRASGTAGHGSRPNPDNPVAHLVTGLARLTEHRWPLTLTPPVRRLLDLTTQALGLDADLSSAEGIEAVLDRIGPLREVVEPALRPSTAVTVLDAGYKYNVVPGEAHAEIDVRSLPGGEAEQLATIDRLLGPAFTRSFLSYRPAIATRWDTPWFDAMAAAVRRHDPDAVVVPYCMAGGTDAKPFAELGIAGFGFSPLGLDPDGRTPAGMHGVDERVPVAALVQGLELLDEFLRTV